MDTIYPSLEEKFKSEGICPICMMTMDLLSRYSCVNNHTMCQRCKPHYSACPTCCSPMYIESSPLQEEDKLLTISWGRSRCPQGMSPSAPPTPDAFHELIRCRFYSAGCKAKLPIDLRQIHESRCQFRPNLENEQLSTDFTHDEETLRHCRYRNVGCNVRLPEWRKAIHENICIYKDRLESVDGVTACLDELSFNEENSYYDPEEMTDCRYRSIGCMVRMPRRKKFSHEEKCNWSKHYVRNEDNEPCPDDDENPDEKVPCVWAEYGCQVTPRLCRKANHEEVCNYRMQRCSYSDNGCEAVFQPSRKYAHEKNCVHSMHQASEWS